MTWTPQFRCPKDGTTWEQEWDFGGEVTCPECGTVYATDYDVDYDDNISGPWVAEAIDPQPAKDRP